MISSRRLASAWHGLVSGEQRSGTKRRVVVSEVQSGSPAEAAGFKTGDELVRVGDLAVANSLDLERGMLDVRPGRPAQVAIRRGKTETTMPLDVRIVSGTACEHRLRRSRRGRLAPAGDQDPARLARLRRCGLAQASRRALHPVGLTGQPGGAGGHPAGRHPGGYECRHPALGDDPGRQYPLRAQAARNESDQQCAALRRAGATESSRAGSASPNRPCIRSWVDETSASPAAFLKFPSAPG